MRSALLLALPLLVQDPSATPTALLEQADGTVVRRELGALRPDDLAELGAVLVTLEGVEPAAPAEASPDRARVELASGDRLWGRVEGGGGDDLELRLQGAGTIALSIDHLASLRFDGRLAPGDRAAMAPAEEADRVYWITPGGLDWDDGTLVELTAEGVEFDGRIGAKLHRWGDLAGLFLQDLGFDDDPGALGDAVAVDLVDLGRLRGRLVELSPRGCRLALGSGDEVLLPLPTVRGLYRDDGSVVFVSDLEPRVERDGSPFDDGLGMRWPPVRDRSVTGLPLVVEGRTYARGLGVHAPSRLVYALDGGFRSLRGEVGVDDQVLRLASRGSVEFRVLVDGELRWSSGVVRGGEPARAIAPVDLTGARELVLEVDMASGYHVADRADWLRVLLVRG